MKRITFGQLFVVVIIACASIAMAEKAVVTASGDAVTADANQISITVALPVAAKGARIDRAVLEIPLTVEETADSPFTEFPLVEIVEVGGDVPKQTGLLERDFDGVARFDVTRFVRGWSDTDDHEFLLGALSESNGTLVDLGVATAWGSGTKARLVVNFSVRNGASAASLGAR